MGSALPRQPSSARSTSKTNAHKSITVRINIFLVLNDIGNSLCLYKWACQENMRSCISLYRGLVEVGSELYCGS